MFGYNAEHKLAALGDLPNKPATELLAQFHDWSPFTRTQAAKALAWQGPSRVPQLIGALRDPNPAVRRAATDAVTELCKPWVALKHHPDLKERDAVAAMQKQVSAAATPLANALADPDAWVRCGAAEALSELGPAAHPVAPALFKALGDLDPWVVERAATALANAGIEGLDKRQLLPAVVWLLKNPRSRTRTAAVKLLDQLGDDARIAAPQLLESVRNRCPDSMFGDGPRLNAVELLAKWKAPEAVPACLALITEKRWGRQHRCGRAIQILATLGPSAKEAVPVLESLAGDTELEKLARKALVAIQK